MEGSRSEADGRPGQRRAERARQHDIAARTQAVKDALRVPQLAQPAAITVAYAAAVQATAAVLTTLNEQISRLETHVAHGLATTSHSARSATALSAFCIAASNQHPLQPPGPPPSQTPEPSSLDISAHGIPNRLAVAVALQSLVQQPRLMAIGHPHPSPASARYVRPGDVQAQDGTSVPEAVIEDSPSMATFG